MDGCAAVCPLLSQVVCVEARAPRAVAAAAAAALAPPGPSAPHRRGAMSALGGHARCAWPVVGRRLLDVGGRSARVDRRPSLVARRSSSVTRRSSFVARRSSPVVRPRGRQQCSAQMGRTRRTRRVVALKRRIAARDARVSKAATAPGGRAPAAAAGATTTATGVRTAPQHSSALFFSHNTQLGPPYRIMVDTNFINFSISNKLDVVQSMMDCLYAKCVPCVTDCVVAELEKLGPKYRLALRIVRDPRFERLPCVHKGTYADDCIVSRVEQHKCYIVATCDRDLKRRLRKIPGVPIMYITAHRYSIERMPEALGGASAASAGGTGRPRGRRLTARAQHRGSDAPTRTSVDVHATPWCAGKRTVCVPARRKRPIGPSARRRPLQRCGGRARATAARGRSSASIMPAAGTSDACDR